MVSLSEQVNGISVIKAISFCFEIEFLAISYECRHGCATIDCSSNPGHTKRIFVESPQIITFALSIRPYDIQDRIKIWKLKKIWVFVKSVVQ